MDTVGNSAHEYICHSRHVPANTIKEVFAHYDSEVALFTLHAIWTSLSSNFLHWLHLDGDFFLFFLGGFLFAIFLFIGHFFFRWRLFKPTDVDRHILIPLSMYFIVLQ